MVYITSINAANAITALFFLFSWSNTNSSVLIFVSFYFF